MKTNINKYIALVLLLIVGASCSDNFLEEKKNYGEYDDTFYQSSERVTSYVNGLYYRYFYTFTSPQGTMTGAYTTDRFRLTEEIGGVQDLTNPAKLFESPDDVKAFAGYYGNKLSDKVKNEPYDRIRDCNSMLENIDKKGANLDQTFRDNVKGQMYYLRALQYFDLMRVYGGVPIVTTVENASSTDVSIQHPRATVGEVVAQIVKDLDMAASLLPGKWSNAATDYGRFTKGAALAQKSRVLLTFASPLFNKNWDTSTDRWEAALQAGLAAETQLTADGYGLYGSSAKDWEAMFSIDNAFCKEVITVQLLSNVSVGTPIYINNPWEKSIRLKSQGGSGSLSAPKEMIDLFPMANGSKPTAANGYDEFLFFKGRDPRFYRTFSFSGNKWGNKENAKPVIWTYRWIDASVPNKTTYNYTDGNQVSSPAVVRKMSNTAASNASNFQYSGTDVFEYRYAELLLNIAECYAAKGDVTNTVAYIGKVRNRVGIPSDNNYGLGTLGDKFAALSACLYERRVELAYEGKRFWDTQRWMLYSDASVPGVVNNTCAKLGLTPINGTQRTGNYLQYNTAVTATDPLLTSRAAISVDPDAADFNTQIANLANFYTTNFTIVPLDSPMDNDGAKNPVVIDFKPNYYIFGLQTSVLTQNTWLLQTIGWTGGSSALGIYNYQD